MEKQMEDVNYLPSQNIFLPSLSEKGICNNEEVVPSESPQIVVTNESEFKNISLPSTSLTDPYEILANEEFLQRKYRPFKRKFLKTVCRKSNEGVVNCDRNEHIFDSVEGSVEELSHKKKHHHDKINQSADNHDESKAEDFLFSDVVKHRAADNKTNQVTSASLVDKFDLSADEESLPISYQPIKRKFYTNGGTSDPSQDYEKVPARSCDKSSCDQSLLDERLIEPTQLCEPEAQNPKIQKRVAYIHSESLLRRTNELIRIKGRADLVHSLIKAYGLLKYIDVVEPRCATDTEVLGFHCPEYVAFLRDVSSSIDADDIPEQTYKAAENFGLSYDCPLQKGIYDTCSLISGATIVAAEKLVAGEAGVAINWYGGWHHAQRSSASGFCYLNDIVLGILKLREKFDRILYVDIDLHHGDGVEEAFLMTPKVMTVSFHKFTVGFFPGSGSVEATGTGRGKNYAVNVPLLDGIKDPEFYSLFQRILLKVRSTFQPQVVILQCGADTLASDPMTSFNLTHLGIGRCVSLVLSWNLPVLLLGGGGYNFSNTAKTWAFLTSLAAGKKLPLDIPEHEHLLAYGPDFELTTSVGNRKDLNTSQHLNDVLAEVLGNLSRI